MAITNYIETFDDGYGGWTGYDKPNVMKSLEKDESTVTARSPYMLDANHAPPGPGYIHILFVLMTKEFPEYGALFTPLSGANGFIDGGYPTDFTDARLTVRLRGDLRERGSKLVLLVQSQIGNTRVAHLLTGQPFEVTKDWSEQTVRLVPDEAQWTCLYRRWEKGHIYDRAPIADVLRDVNVDIIFALFPLDVVPVGALEVTKDIVEKFAPGRMPPADLDPMHALRAGRDYAVDWSRLPEGHVTLDEIRIEFANGAQK